MFGLSNTTHNNTTHHTTTQHNPTVPVPEDEINVWKHGGDILKGVLYEHHGGIAMVIAPFTSISFPKARSTALRLITFCIRSFLL